MMGAESIGKYFGANIKSNPAHPFVKVEAPDPTEPASAKASASESGQNGINTTKTILSSQPSPVLDGVLVEGLTSDAPPPGSALAEIDALKPEFIFVPGNVDSILVKLRDEVLAMAKGLDPSTPAKQKRIREIKGLVVSRRTFIEKVRVGYVADLVLKKSVTDTVSKAVQGRLSSIEDEILKVTGYSAWEQGVKDRKAKNEKTVLDINAMQPHVYSTIDSLILAIAQLNAIDTESMEELSALATGAKKQRLEMLTADLVKRQDAERDAAELAELRRKQAEREEADRKAEQDRQEEERIQAAAIKLSNAQIQQAVEAAKVETRQEVIAELAAPVESKLVEENEQDAPELYIYPEIPQSVRMPVFHAQGGVVETHEQRLNGEIIAGLMGFAAVDRQAAIRVLKAIKAGNVPHVTITY
jgi:hypothetical protein